MVILESVSAIRVGPRPIASPTGRQVCGVVGPAIRQLDWGMELVEGDHGLRGQHTGHRFGQSCLSSNIDLLIR